MASPTARASPLDLHAVHRTIIGRCPDALPSTHAPQGTCRQATQSQKQVATHHPHHPQLAIRFSVAECSTHESAAHVRGLVCVRASGALGNVSAFHTRAVWRSKVASTWPSADACRPAASHGGCAAGELGRQGCPVGCEGSQDTQGGRRGSPPAALLGRPWHARLRRLQHRCQGRTQTACQPAAGASGCLYMLRQCMRCGVVTAE